MTASRFPDFPNNVAGNRRLSRRPENGRFVGGAPLKCGPSTVGAGGRFSGPVFAGNPDNVLTCPLRYPDEFPKSRFPDFPNDVAGNRSFSRLPEIGRFVGGAALKCGPAAPAALTLPAIYRRPLKPFPPT